MYRYQSGIHTRSRVLNPCRVFSVTSLNDHVKVFAVKGAVIVNCYIMLKNSCSCASGRFFKLIVVNWSKSLMLLSVCS